MTDRTWPFNAPDNMVVLSNICEHSFGELHGRRWCCKCGADGGLWRRECSCCGREEHLGRPMIWTNKGWVCATDGFCRAGTDKPMENGC